MHFSKSETAETEVTDDMLAAAFVKVIIFTDVGVISMFMVSAVIAPTWKQRTAATRSMLRVDVTCVGDS